MIAILHDVIRRLFCHLPVAPFCEAVSLTDPHITHNGSTTTHIILTEIVLQCDVGMYLQDEDSRDVIVQCVGAPGDITRAVWNMAMSTMLCVGLLKLFNAN